MNNNAGFTLTFELLQKVEIKEIKGLKKKKLEKLI